MRKDMMLLVNPVAGRGTLRNGFGEMLETFYKGGYLPTVYFTEHAGQARELAAAYGERYELLVCLGGDGTLSDVMSGLVTLGKKPKIGYIPMGTANDIATTLGLSHNVTKAAQTILKGRALPYDVGSFGDGTYFSYIAAFGAFTEVSYETRQERKQALGHLAYLLEGLARLPKLSSYHTRIEYDEGVIEEDLCFGGVTNSTSVAGLVRLDSSLVQLGDGRFEVILVRTPKTVGDLNKILSGIMAKNYNNEHILLLQSRKVRFTFDRPVAWTRDGESGGQRQKVQLENLCSAVEIYVDA